MEYSSHQDIWIESQKLLDESKHREHSYIHGYSTLLFVGSHFGGKTSIINRFIDPASSTKLSSKYEETIALEYYFTRRPDDQQQSGNVQKVCNIWELGYELLFIDLIQFAITSNTIRNSSLIIVLDLTRPNEISILLESFLEQIRFHLDSLIVGQSDFSHELKQLAKKRSVYYRSEDHHHDEDDVPSDPLLIPLTIIGSKYDEFQNMDPEIKKQITKYLRTVSYHHGGQLLYHSSKSDTLTKRVNQALESLAFDQLKFNLEDRSKPSVSTNVSKPVLLPFGYDTLSKIGVSKSSSVEVRQQFISMFPQKDLQQSYQSTMSEDPRLDPNFSEPEIDKILEYKYMLLDSNSM